jgi:YHS domain-containing protein
MRRILLLLAAFLALFWWIGRLLKSARGPAQAPGQSSREASAPQGQMVRDRVCNTFLPRDRALRHEIGGEVFFFCSDACRDRFLAEKTPQSQ